MSNNLNFKSILAAWPTKLNFTQEYCVGLSGGVDSVVLLHLFYQLQKIYPFKLTAIHVHHGLSSNANSWVDFCVYLCQKFAIPLEISYLQVVKQSASGLENSARKLRYAEYHKNINRVMLLAHHQDDLVETTLSQLMRGSDIHNLAAMQPLSLKRGQLFWRPLLIFTKQQIIAYAKEQQLNNIEDESNQDVQYLRNFLRNQILPQLKQYDPHIHNKLVNSVHTIQEAAALSDEFAQLDLINISKLDGAGLDRKQFSQLSSLRQLNALSYFLINNSIALPSKRQLVEFTRQVAQARSDRKPSLKLNETLCLCATYKIIGLEKIN